MRKISNTDLEEQRSDSSTRPSDSRNATGAREYRSGAPPQSSENKAWHGQPQEVDTRVFSRIYSHIAQHRGTSDTGVLVDLIWAISLDRSAFYFETLERLEPRTRDLGLELVKAKLCSAFPPEAWEDAHQFANELNQSTNAKVSSPSPPARGAIKEQSSTPRVAQDSQREACRSTGVFGFGSKSPAGRAEASPATTVKRVNSERELGRETRESGTREHRRLRHRARMALAYASQYGGFDGFNYLWGAAAAATVLGLFALVIALDERVLDRRFEMFGSWFSAPVESSPQIQEPVIARVDTTQFAAPAPEAAKTEPEASSEQSTLPPDERELVIEEPTSVDGDKPVITPPLAVATESAAREDSSLVQDIPLTPPSQETSVEQGGTAAGEPPKPIQRAVPKKAKSDKTRLKAAKPSLAKRSAAPPKPPTIGTVEQANELQPKTPETPRVAEPLVKPAIENPAPPVAVAQPAIEAASKSVEKPNSDPVTVGATEPVRDAPQPREKIIANPSFVERLMGFKTGERIARIQPGRRADQPGFIRQLEGVEGPAEPADRADVETN